MRICLDLDGVIAQLKSSGQDYSECLPVPGAIEKIRDLKNNGHYIIIYTARHMKTCNANPGLTIARIGKITLEWLERHNIEYDEIHFGKPWADIYIDDNAFRFIVWDDISPDGQNLPLSHEKQVRDK